MYSSLVFISCSVLLSSSIFAKEQVQQLTSSPLSAADDRPLLRVAFHDEIGTWAIDKYNNALVHVNQVWKQVSQNINHVTVGEAGVWIIDDNNSVLYRQGVSEHMPQGVQWTNIKGDFKSLSAGKEGCLYGIDMEGSLQFRDGFSCTNPLGERWKFMGLNISISHLSCGKRGCWFTYSNGSVSFAPANGKRGCRLSTFKEIELMKDGWDEDLEVDEVSTSPSGWRVAAITWDGRLFKRNGLSDKSPQGTHWQAVVNEYKYTTAVPCHMGYIAIAKDNKATFVTNLPKCHELDIGWNDMDTGGIINRPSTWGIKRGQTYQKQGSEWVSVEGEAMKQISTSGNDVWAVSKNNEVYTRSGITCSNPYGVTWQKISNPTATIPPRFQCVNRDAKCDMIDSGKFGLVYVVTEEGAVHCREGITQSNRTGKSWSKVSDEKSMAYVSCGDFGCWGVDKSHEVFYRSGIKSENCAGESWIPVPSPFQMKIVESGHHGLVFGIDTRGRVHARVATSEMDPMGTSWIQMYTFKKFIDISHAQLRIFLIDSSGVIYKCN